MALCRLADGRQPGITPIASSARFRRACAGRTAGPCPGRGCGGALARLTEAAAEAARTDSDCIALLPVGIAETMARPG